MNRGQEPGARSEEPGDEAPPGSWLLGRIDVRRGDVEDRRRHLTGNEPLPDQVVQAELVRIEEGADLLRVALSRRRTDRLVRFLSQTAPGAVDTRSYRNQLRTVLRGDHSPRLGNRRLRDGDRVGPHIRDQADALAAVDRDALVELLRDGHRPPGREAELSSGFLLQGRGNERARWVLPLFSLSDGADAV
jgi:hypothetical protein